MKKFVKFTDKEIETLLDYIIKNYQILTELFYNINEYVHIGEIYKITNEELELFNSIPIPEKYKLKLPIIIYRGMFLSDKMIKTIIVKFKKEKEKFNYKPRGQFSSWSLSKNIADIFSNNNRSKSKYGYGLIFESNLTNKNKFIDINLFFCIMENINKFLTSKYNSNKLSKEESKLYKLSNITLLRYNELEIIVFGKLKVTNIYKSK